MKQSLQLKLGQSLTMTPQLQQAIRLLQLSTLDLQQEMEEANDERTSSSEESSEETGERQTAAETAGESANQTTEPTAEDDWNEQIPQDLPVDTSWDDIYTNTSSSLPSSNYDGDDSDFESRRSSTETLYDHLMWQLNLTHFSDRDRVIAMAIIDAVEPSGLLSNSIEDIYEGIREGLQELELDEVQAVQRRLQQFDP